MIWLLSIPALYILVGLALMAVVAETDTTFPFGNRLLSAAAFACLTVWLPLVLVLLFVIDGKLFAGPEDL